MNSAGYFNNSLAALLALSAPELLPFFLPPDAFFPPEDFFIAPSACFTTFLASFSNPAMPDHAPFLTEDSTPTFFTPPIAISTHLRDQAPRWPLVLANADIQQLALGCGLSVD